jgi:cell division protein FtsQ
MDKKVRERRQAVNKERGRRRAGWFVLAAAVLIALGLFLWLRSSEILAVTRVTATATEHISEQSIADATAEARGVSLLKLGLGGIEENLSKLAYVRSADLHRRFPNTLEVTLEEYEPVACVQTTDRGRWLVGDDGRVLEKKSDPALALIVPESQFDIAVGGDLPAMIVGALSVALAVSGTDAGAGLPPVSKIAVSSGGEVTLTLDGPIELRLGEPTELDQKLKVAGTIIQQYLRDGKTLEYVDARVPDRIAVNSK